MRLVAKSRGLCEAKRELCASRRRRQCSHAAAPPGAQFSKNQFIVRYYTQPHTVDAFVHSSAHSRTRGAGFNIRQGGGGTRHSDMEHQFSHLYKFLACGKFFGVLMLKIAPSPSMYVCGGTLVVRWPGMQQQHAAYKYPYYNTTRTVERK